MNENELIKNTLGGIVMGFSIGIGFILAQKLMSKKVLMMNPTLILILITLL